MKFQITKEEYNYLLPIFGNFGSKKLLSKIDRKVEKYYFIGNVEEHKDMLNRCAYMK
jgi:hypothetical protein